LNNIVTLKSGLEVTQDHSNCMVPFESLDEVSYSPYIVTITNYILHQFRDKDRY